MTDKQQIKLLKSKITFQKKVLIKLIDFFEVTSDALYMEKKGHTVGWDKVQKITDSIEDKYDLSEIKSQSGN
jgi:hypothetical protein